MARRRGLLATMVKMQREAERDRQRRARAAQLMQQRQAREAERERQRQQRAVESERRSAARVDANQRRDAAAAAAREVQVQRQRAAVAAEDDAKRAAAEETEALDLRVAALEGVLGATLDVDDFLDLELLKQHSLDQPERLVELTALQEGLAVGKPEAVVSYLDLVLESAQYPDGFPHSWRLTFQPGSNQLTIAYELPAFDVVPESGAVKYESRTGRSRQVPRPMPERRSLYLSVLRQTALRVVHEVLEADRRGVVRTVVFNGHISGVDPATGRRITPCVLAYATTRDRFLALNLARIDVTACLQHLEARVSKDPSKFIAVEPIALAGSLDSDVVVDTEDDGPVQGSAGHAPIAVREELVAGQNAPLRGDYLEIRLSGQAADLSVLLLDESGRVRRDEDFVFYNNPRSRDGAVCLAPGDSPDSAAIRLPGVHPGFVRLLLVASADTGIRSVGNATVAVRHGDGTAELRFRAGEANVVTALVCGEIYRREGSWRFRAVGQGWADGLAGLARDYGVNVN